MKNNNKRKVIAIAIAIAFPLNAMADAKYDALKQQVELLQQQLQQVQAALEEQQAQGATKQDVAELKQDVADVSAQSTEWKTSDSIVHLAGYGDVSYSDAQNNEAAFNAVRFNPIIHYQYKDFLLMETELETRILKDGSTDVGVEYATIDLFLNDYVTLLAGKFMSPLGQFRQNGHPSWINKLTSAPVGFGHDQAAPNADVGVELRGGFGLGNNTSFANYAVYTANGPVLAIVGNEIDEVSTGGRTSNDDGELVYGGRIGFLPIPMLEIGFSGATGKVAGDVEPNATRDYDVYGVDFNFKRNNFRLLSEYIRQDVGSASNSASPNSASWEAFYAQMSYRLMPTLWEGVLRYGDYNAPNNDLDQTQWAIGVNYLFASNAMVKFAYNFNDGRAGTIADDDVFQTQLSYGF
ncbi:MAG: hypothetical protein COA63_011940 [Methylophaga sp.]|nr:hypothetical protein [Methylophaga sp.]